MPGTKAGGKRAAATNKKRYGENYYSRIGVKGGSSSNTGGFAYMKRMGMDEKIAEAGRKGGSISRKGAKAKWEYIKPRHEPFGVSGGRVDFLEDLATALTGDQKQDAETALYTEDDGLWRILWGDHRKAYENAFPSKQECLKVYERLKPEHGSSKWSTDER
jgi:general stress protein YciG